GPVSRSGEHPRRPRTSLGPRVARVAIRQRDAPGAPTRGTRVARSRADRARHERPARRRPRLRRVGRAQEAEPLGALRWIWIASIAAAVLAAVAVVAIGHGDRSGSSAPAPAARVGASLDQTAVDFGDPVTATVSVTAPGDAAIHIGQDLAPLTQLGTPRITRVTQSGSQTVTYAARGTCLDDRCVATSNVKRIALRPATVT